MKKFLNEITIFIVFCVYDQRNNSLYVRKDLDHSSTYSATLAEISALRVLSSMSLFSYCERPIFHVNVKINFIGLLS